jgi:hypothetical protein
MKKTRTNPKTRDDKMVIDAEVVGEEKKTKKSKPKTTAIAKTENNALSFNAETLISQAITAKADVGTMERLLAMRKTLKDEWAKEQFDKAMAAFQSECPIIKKTKTVKTKSGEKAYSYAPLEQDVIQVKPLLIKYGFSYSFLTETKEKTVKATCIAKHKDGHSEPSSMEVPNGNKTAVMSDSQVTAAAISFAKRYAFLNVFGIIVGDEDNEELLPKDKEIKDATNYLDKLKAALIRKGAKNVSDALRIFNEISGYNLTEFPKQNSPEVKELYDVYMSSPNAL